MHFRHARWYFIGVAVLAVTCSGCICARRGDKSPRAVTQPDAPIGRLGYPIGTYLTIEGVRAEQGKVGVRTLLVEKIGERRLASPTQVWIENCKQLPEGRRCILRGYESGAWLGLPPEVQKAMHSEPQALWGFQLYFIAVYVESPKDLEIEGWPGPPPQ